MIRTYTDQQMLAAAERRLYEHIATRPATRAQAEQYAAAEREQAATLRAQACALPRTPTISSLIERGERGQHVLDMGHALGRAESARCKEVSRLHNAACRHDLRAESWDTVAASPEGAVWEATRRELAERVEYYRSLVAAGGGRRGDDRDLKMR